MGMTACWTRAVIVGFSAVVGTGGIGLWCGTAFAAGTGYGPGTGAGATAPGGFSNVVTSQTVAATGGSVGASFQGETVSVSIPAGDFSGPVQVTITSPSTTAIRGAVTAFDLSFSVNGNALSGPLPRPVTFTIKDASITSGDIVDVWNGSSWVAYTNASVENGSVVITVTSDPAFAVLTSSTTSPATVSGATTATTGLPVATMAGVGAGMAIVGGMGLIFFRRRKSAAAQA